MATLTTQVWNSAVAGEDVLKETEDDFNKLGEKFARPLTEAEYYSLIAFFALLGLIIVAAAAGIIWKYLYASPAGRQAAAAAQPMLQYNAAGAAAE
ncbi:hypothetical protein PFISCL1PPCAC_29030 [Pristionchus fissidentatus]|uniref:Uncharacterized protein n=1 Tax=Pristionchus fissidentatus TaxID=1538716 RepID=A0AAV5X383_9BILA|nr:hypothetical protein PFISCL1PPCAC_7384 [Pristionchus fissidentatus]GMT37733.1 hypothetical protein PFISCL1PPCAC_29030 [Pristionchus fissidentatus]